LERNVCYTFGHTPTKRESLVGFTVKLKWLREHVATSRTTYEEELHAHVRAYILGLIGEVLMLNKTSNKVHLIYL